MSTQEQVRALMVRHHQMIKNREQCMLSRVATEIGMPAETAHFWNHIQGKPQAVAQMSYDRSHATMS